MNKIKALAGQTAIYGTSSIVARLINYLLVPFYTRIFATAEFGVVTEMYAYVAFLVVVLMYGMETAFFRFYKSDNNKNSVYSTTLISLLATSTIFIAFSFLLSNDIANLLKYPNNSEYVIWFASIIALDALSAVPFARLRADNRPKKFAVIKVLNIVINVFFNFFFLLFCPLVVGKDIAIISPLVEFFFTGVDVKYIFISNLISSAITILILSPEMLKINFVFDVKLWKKMMIYALPLLVFGLAGIVNETLDRIMLKNILPESLAMSQLGIYGACYKVAILMTIIIQAFRYAAEPFFFAQENEKDSKQIYADIMKYFVIFLSFVFLGIMMYIDIVMYFVGEEFRIGAPIVPILLIANLCLGIFYNQSVWYKLTNKTIYGAVIAIFGAIITIGLNYWWIPKIGYMGSAWATLVCYASMVIVSWVIGRKHYPIKYDLKRILGFLGLAIALYFISTFTVQFGDVVRYIINTMLLSLFVLTVYRFEKSKLLRITNNN